VIGSSRPKLKVARATTDKKVTCHWESGAGTYSVMFRKPGLSTASVDSVQVFAGKTRSLAMPCVWGLTKDRLLFCVAAFTEQGRSVPYVKVELARCSRTVRYRN